MTRASYARIAKRAEKFDPQTFKLPPDGILSERVDLEPYRLVLGLQHPEGAPILVCAWNGESMMRMLPEQASAWADELVAAGQAVPLAPVIEAVRVLVKRAGDIAVAAAMQALNEVPA